jgi:hypothetical protein
MLFISFMRAMYSAYLRASKVQRQDTQSSLPKYLREIINWEAVLRLQIHLLFFFKGISVAIFCRAALEFEGLH